MWSVLGSPTLVLWPSHSWAITPVLERLMYIFSSQLVLAFFHVDQPRGTWFDAIFFLRRWIFRLLRCGAVKCVRLSKIITVRQHLILSTETAVLHKFQRHLIFCNSFVADSAACVYIHICGHCLCRSRRNLWGHYVCDRRERAWAIWERHLCTEMTTVACS